MRHHDALVRTTVTLDADVEQLLRDAMHRSRKPFKRVLNEAIRSGLSHGLQPKSKPFTLQARPMGLRAGIDPGSFNRLADELEADAILEKAAR